MERIIHTVEKISRSTYKYDIDEVNGEIATIPKKRESYGSNKFGNELIKFYTYELFGLVLDKIQSERENGLRIDDNIQMDVARLREARSNTVRHVKEILKEYLFRIVFSELISHNNGSKILEFLRLDSLLSSVKRRRRGQAIDLKNLGSKTFSRLPLHKESKLAKILYERLEEVDIIDLMDNARDLFIELKFAYKYGGPKWSEIAELGYKLWTSTSEKEDVILIDRIVDLQHNSGSVLNKSDTGFEIDRSPSQPFEFVVFLDAKRHFNTLTQFIDFYNDENIHYNQSFTNNNAHLVKQTLISLHEQVLRLSKKTGNEVWERTIKPVLRGIL